MFFLWVWLVWDIGHRISHQSDDSSENFVRKLKADQLVFSLVLDYFSLILYYFSFILHYFSYLLHFFPIYHLSPIFFISLHSSFVFYYLFSLCMYLNFPLNSVPFFFSSSPLCSILSVYSLSVCEGVCGNLSL